MTVIVTDNVAAILTASLHEQEFWHNQADGFWYPGARDAQSIAIARARIQVDGGTYAIQTRRSQTGPWTLLVKALVSDFDPAIFRTWCVEWPLQLS